MSFIDIEKHDSIHHEGVGLCRHISVAIISINILQAYGTCEGVAERKPKEQQKLWNWFTFIFLQGTRHLVICSPLASCRSLMESSWHPITHSAIEMTRENAKPGCYLRGWIMISLVVTEGICGFAEDKFCCSAFWLKIVWSLFLCNDKEAGEASGSISESLKH